ncbi:hypothetical protein GCM10009540_45180 [Streptomyces turgidiscabies]
MLRSQAITWSGVMYGSPYETRIPYATCSGPIPRAVRSLRAAWASKGGVGGMGGGDGTEGRRTRHKLGAPGGGDYGLFGHNHGL